MRVRVRHTVDRLADRLDDTNSRLAAGGPRVVAANIDYGRDLAKAVARVKSGPHGKAYYKRINSEMHAGLGPFGNAWSGEFGPDGTPKTEFVGAGFRHGGNTDLEQAATPAATELARDVRRLIAEMFA